MEKGRLVGPPKERKEKERKERQKAKEESTRERRAKEEAEERAGADPLKGGLARVEDEAKGVWRDPWEHAALDGAGGAPLAGDAVRDWAFVEKAHSAVGMHRISR